MVLTNQDVLEHVRTTVTDNERVFGKTENRAVLCLNIKWKQPSLNTGTKATKELVLFS